MYVSPLINTVLFLVMALALAGAALASRRSFLFMCGFYIPFITPGLQVGVNLFWYTLVGAFGVALLLVRRGPARFRIPERQFRLFLIYVVLSSLFWMLAEYSILERYKLAQLIGLGSAQTVYKMPVQLASFMFQCLAFFVVPLWARSHEEAKGAARGMLLGLMLSTLAGFVMLASTGAGFVGEKVSGGEIAVMGTDFSRVGGLSGEPKHLGAFLVIGLGLVMAEHLAGSTLLRLRYKAALFGTMMVGLFLTYSTSAWIAFAGMSVVFMTQFRLRRRIWMSAAASIVVAAAATQVPIVAAILRLRVLNRVAGETSELEQSKDNYVRDIYTAKPLLAPIGFGLGGTDLEATPLMLYDSRYSRELQYVRTPTPSTTGVRLLGDVGLLGLGLLALAVRSWQRALKSKGFAGLAAFTVAGGVGVLLLSFNAIAPYLFLCGAALVLAQPEPHACS